MRKLLVAVAVVVAVVSWPGLADGWGCGPKTKCPTTTIASVPETTTTTVPATYTVPSTSTTTTTFPAFSDPENLVNEDRATAPETLSTVLERQPEVSNSVAHRLIRFTG